MTQEMFDFITERNIRRFTKLLKNETDPDKRAVLLQLLRDERAKSYNNPLGRPTSHQLQVPA